MVPTCESPSHELLAHPVAWPRHGRVLIHGSILPDSQGKGEGRMARPGGYPGLPAH